MAAAAQAPVNEPILLTRITPPVATLTLNRPRHYNALSADLLSALQQALDDVAGNDAVRVVVMAAHGKAFCAGHDLKEMRSSEDRAYHQALFERCAKVMQTIQRLPQPVLASVQGIATAAGCQLVAQCDLAVAADTARFAVSGINVGLFCSTPAVPLSRNMHRKQALQMLLTGDFIDAGTAQRFGLVNEVVPAAELEATVVALAQKIASKSSLAITLGKKMFYQQAGMDLSAAYEFAGERMTCNMDSDDARAGIDAFIEKRRPVWKGR
ncbi:MAG: enoyl-CoA hydratase [Gammaproteobacteria bacterium]|nr:enoyl-CoA hydratase [Gammaproteobacteria bacterium]MCY4337938.1 enoyl-CoA hydratase [Gammaproteobacteria bacterium]